MLAPEANRPSLDSSAYDHSEPGKAERVLEKINKYTLMDWGVPLLLFIATIPVWHWNFLFVGPLLVAYFGFSLAPNMLEGIRSMNIHKGLEDQLEARGDMALETWATYRGQPDPEFQEFAKLYCKLVSRSFGWKSTNFVPWDESAAVFYPAKGDAARTFHNDFEWKYKFTLSDGELSLIGTADMGQLVALCYDRIQEAKTPAALAEATAAC